MRPIVTTVTGFTVAGTASRGTTIGQTEDVMMIGGSLVPASLEGGEVGAQIYTEIGIEIASLTDDRTDGSHSRQNDLGVASSIGDTFH